MCGYLYKFIIHTTHTYYVNKLLFWMRLIVAHPYKHLNFKTKLDIYNKFDTCMGHLIKVVEIWQDMVL